MTIEDTPPTDFSLHHDPKRIPNPMNKNDVTTLINIPYIMETDQNEESSNPPTIKNKID